MTLADLDRLEAASDYLVSIFRAIFPQAVSVTATMIGEDWQVYLTWENGTHTTFIHTDSSDGDGSFCFTSSALDEVVSFPLNSAFPAEL